MRLTFKGGDAYTNFHPTFKSPNNLKYVYVRERESQPVKGWLLICFYLFANCYHDSILALKCADTHN